MPNATTPLNAEQATAISAGASRVFLPRTPVSTQALFAGRTDQMLSVIDAVNQVGLHVVIYGERGVGKTSLANVIGPLLVALENQARERSGETPDPRIIVRVNAHSQDGFASLWRKALDDITWQEDRPQAGFSVTGEKEVVTLRSRLGLPEELGIDHVRRTLTILKGSVFVFDEFDRLPGAATTYFTDLIKSLSDASIDSTVVLVGVSETLDGLIADHASIGRALVQVPMPRMSQSELLEIIKKAEEGLNVKFEDACAGRITRVSQGLPHYTHLLGLHSLRAACDQRSPVVRLEHFRAGYEKSLEQADRSLTNGYEAAIQSAQKALYEQVLVACALAASASAHPHGYFQPADVARPLARILGKDVTFSTFNNHLHEFAKDERGPVLERTGRERAYRFRFKDPLLLPYVLMCGLKRSLISEELVAEATGPS